MKVTAYIEYSKDGLFSVYTTEYGFMGYGDTEEEARQNFIDAYNKFFDMGWCKDVLEFEFKRINTMSDKEKIKIKQEIERRINISLEQGYTYSAAQLKKVIDFINSLPEEPASEDLENIIGIVGDENIMYANRTAGIKSFAETYSFNIESVLFNQLTLEQQELWRKEIETAVISGGEMGLELADDKRYEERASNEDLDEAAYKYCEKVNHRQTCIITDSFKAGAEWQKQKDKQLIGTTQKISHQHGYDAAIVDGVKIKADTWYTCVNGELVEVDKKTEVFLGYK